MITAELRHKCTNCAGVYPYLPIMYTKEGKMTCPECCTKKQFDELKTNQSDILIIGQNIPQAQDAAEGCDEILFRTLPEQLVAQRVFRL